MMNDKEIFIEWLKFEIKINKTMKGCELAKKAFIHPTTISKYINNKSLPRSQDEIDKICKTLGADYSEIIMEGRKKDEQTKQIKIQLKQNRNHPLNIDSITEEHCELVKKFSSKKIALEVNRCMVNLDKNDSIRFGELASIVRKFANGVDFVEVKKEETEKTFFNKTGTEKNG